MLVDMLATADPGVLNRRIQWWSEVPAAIAVSKASKGVIASVQMLILA
jgi:hypothetical protein